MPLNDYECSECGTEIFDILAKDEVEARTKIQKNHCPFPFGDKCSLKRKLSTANFGDPFKMGHIKTDPGFREQLQRIKKANPGSTIQ